jgi:hypothetical protein
VEPVVVDDVPGLRRKNARQEQDPLSLGEAVPTPGNHVTDDARAEAG